MARVRSLGLKCLRHGSEMLHEIDAKQLNPHAVLQGEGGSAGRESELVKPGLESGAGSRPSWRSRRLSEAKGTSGIPQRCTLVQKVWRDPVERGSGSEPWCESYG